MNGSAKRFMEATQPELERIFFAALGGILLGLFVLLIFKLPIKFTYFLIAGPVILFIAILTGRFKRFFQGVMFFIIPLNYSTHFFRRPYEFGAGGLDFSPLDIVLIVLYAIWLYELLLKKSRHFHLFPTITIPAIGLVVISALSMLTAPDPYLTFFETIQIFKVILLYLYVANHIRSKRDVSFVLVFLLVGLFLQSLIAFSQRWLGISLGLEFFGEYAEMQTFTLDYYLVTSRVGGTIGHPNGLAKYVELLMPLSMVLLFTEIKLRKKLASGLVFICAFIVLLLTMSRGGWICFTGSMVLVFLLILRAKLITLRTLVAIAVVVVIFAGLGLGFSDMIKSRLFGDDYGAAHGRIPLNRVAFSVIRNYPLLGVGVKNYQKVAYLFNPNLETVPYERVHNMYLLAAAETGIPGLLILLWFLGSVFLQGLRNLKTKDIFLISLNIGILGGMAALWTHWLVDHGYIGRVAVFWVLTGLVAARGRIYKEKRPLHMGAERIHT
jgi:O-antigen ligase